jgi:hypothetical protein
MGKGTFRSRSTLTLCRSADSEFVRLLNLPPALGGPLGIAGDRHGFKES